MSSGTQVALLTPSGRHAAPPRLEVEAAAEQPVVRLLTFAALGLYGVLRWSTLLSGRDEGRLLGLLVLAVLVAGSGLVGRNRLVQTVVAIVAALTAFAVAGVPVAWVVHLRVAVTAAAIGDGLSALPRAFVPYSGINQWVQTVIVLGAGVLLFDAALLLAFAPRALGDLRRAGAALPMLALTAVPATLVHPKFAYLDGLVLFVLLAAFIWGERIRRAQLGGALALCAAAAVAAMVAAPAIDPHKPWVNPLGLAGGLAPAKVDSFDWSQTYGPIHWPRKGRAVLEVQASHGEYWKAENLDTFNGTGWNLGSVLDGGDPMTTVSPAAISRWTQSLRVTVSSMNTTNVIGAGQANPPQHLPETLLAGASPGTWSTATQIGPGDSYSIQVYAPNPSPAQLASAGARYPRALIPGYLSLQVPASRTAGVTRTTIFPPFHSAAATGSTGANPASVMLSSPYARMYALARRLAGHAHTPYAFVGAVESYLAHGYTYNEDPPPSRYPLESFLFSSYEGYCQQFAGSMALLLRMGGVPARVAVGFTKGTYDSATKRWIVDDTDAHAWVEAWFPHYGWVELDPTPAADPALGGHVQTPSAASSSGGSAHATPSTHRTDTRSPARAASAAVRTASPNHGGGLSAIAVAGIVAALVLLAVLALGTRPLAGGEAMIAELERAMARTGRPVAGGTTLSAIERRLGSGSAAAAYVRALRMQRFGAGRERPTGDQ
ncbi:MAG TPA: transglutaminase-like domain-containing protein, partial [Solirubrobacteraceae bacterium]|nr:transglutaminase-like domain-containing protein [Solirubrobacteraceae bacterium]